MNTLEQNVSGQRPAEVAGAVDTALHFSENDRPASAAAFYLRHQDDIFTARKEVQNGMLDSWVIGDGTTFCPDSSNLTKGALLFAARSALETTEVVGTCQREIEHFWYHVGTQIAGAEVEVFKAGVKEGQFPITSNGVIQNALRDRTTFLRQYNQLLGELEQR